MGENIIKSAFGVRKTHNALPLDFCVFQAHGLDNIYEDCYYWQLQPDPLAQAFGSHRQRQIQMRKQIQQQKQPTNQPNG